MPGLRLEKVEFRVYRGSELRATGRADRIDYLRDADELVARKLAATLPREREVRLTAEEGEGRLRAGVFTTSHGIVLEQGDVRATTDSARYEARPVEVIRGDHAVTVDGPAWRLTGEGFTVDPATGDLAVGDRVRLEARPAGGR